MPLPESSPSRDRAAISLWGAAVACVAISAGGMRLTESSLFAHAPTASSQLECVGSDATLNAVAVELVDLINADRTAAGVPTLVWSGQLSCLARAWSDSQASAGTLQHRDLDAILGSAGFGRYRTLGENLLRGPADTDAAAMHRAWMKSPDHRRNILDPAFTSVGIALAYTGDGRVFATENFAA